MTILTKPVNNSIGTLQFPITSKQINSSTISEKTVSVPTVPINAPNQTNQNTSSSSSRKWKIITVACLATIAVAATTAFLAHNTYTSPTPIFPSIRGFFSTDNSLKETINYLETQILGYKEAETVAQSTIQTLQDKIGELTSQIQDYEITEKASKETILQLKAKVDSLSSTSDSVSSFQLSSAAKIIGIVLCVLWWAGLTNLRKGQPPKTTA